MINIKTYKAFNESLRDKIKGKTDDDIINSLNKLSDSDKIKKIIFLNLSYDLLPTKLDTNGVPNDLVVVGSLWCDYNNLTSLPDNLTVQGDLYCTHNKLTSLPKGLVVKGILNCRNNLLTSLPDDLIVERDLNCEYNLLPDDIKKPIGVRGGFFT